MEVEGEQTEEFMDVAETSEEQVEERTEISLNTLMGLNTSHGRISTIK